MPMETAHTRACRRTCPENVVDVARVIEIAARYPAIEVSALAERFGTSDRTIYNVLDRAGIQRGDDQPLSPIPTPVHPWRPAPRRKPAAIAMSKAERQRLVDDFLAKHSVTRVPCGQMATSDVTYLDTIQD